MNKTADPKINLKSIIYKGKTNKKAKGKLYLPPLSNQIIHYFFFYFSADIFSEITVSQLTRRE